MKKLKNKLQDFNHKMRVILRMLKSDVYILYYASKDLSYNAYQTNMKKEYQNISMSILYSMINSGHISYDSMYETIIKFYPNYDFIYGYIERHSHMSNFNADTDAVSDILDKMYKYYIDTEDYEKCGKLSDIINHRNQSNLKE